MSKRIDELSKDLASGMSRRRAMGRFFSGLGVAAGALFLGGKKAYAEGNDVCVAFCSSQGAHGADFGHCVAASARCPPGACAYVVSGRAICVPVGGPC